MKKVIIILSIVFIFVGLSLSITALAVNKFDFEKMANIHYINEEYDLEETINDIEIKEIVNDIEFYSLDELDDVPASVTCRVVTHNIDKISHEVKVEDNTLKIDTKDDSKWFEFILGNKNKTKIYLASNIYNELTIKGSTCDIKIGDEFTFDKIDLKTSTGDISLKSSANSIKINTSTGDVKIYNINNVNKLTIDVSTGDVLLDHVVVDETSIETSTGDVRFKSFEGKTIKVKVSTGDVTGTLVGDYQFDVDTSTGDRNYPKNSHSDTNTCYIRTSTGDVDISLV